jgi:DNA-binding transcriptional ArsR family regulator
MVAEALNSSADDYKLSSLRYELSKLRAKGLVEKLPRSRRYGLLQDGYRLSFVFLKLFERLYAPLTAGLLDPVGGDANPPDERISNLDRLYLAVSTALDNLLKAVGLEAA